MAIPVAPTINKIYNGFLITPFPGFPGPTVPPNATGVEFLIRTSTDDNLYSPWQVLGAASGYQNFQFIHSGALANIYYQYAYIIQYNDGTSSVQSDYAIPGELSNATNYGSTLDQLASSLGTFQSGYLRGVVFETSANYPKVRMDPTGFFAINGLSTPIRIEAGGSAVFSGIINAISVQIQDSIIGGLPVPVLVDGGFENPGNTTWGTENGAAGTFTFDNTVSHSGSYSAKFVSTAGDAIGAITSASGSMFYQGVPYTLSFWAVTPSAPIPLDVSAVFGATAHGDYIPFFFVPTRSWQQYTFTWVPQTNYIPFDGVVEFLTSPSSAAGSSVNIDDVVISTSNMIAHTLGTISFVDSVTQATPVVKIANYESPPTSTSTPTSLIVTNQRASVNLLNSDGSSSFLQLATPIQAGKPAQISQFLHVPLPFVGGSGVLTYALPKPFANTFDYVIGSSAYDNHLSSTIYFAFTPTGLNAVSVWFNAALTGNEIVNIMAVGS